MTHDEASLLALLDSGWKVESAIVGRWVTRPDPPLVVVLTREERQLRILPFRDEPAVRAVLRGLGVVVVREERLARQGSGC